MASIDCRWWMPNRVIPVFVKGINKHSLDEGLRLPDSIIADIKARMNDNKTLSGKVPEKVKLSSRLLNHRLEGYHSQRIAQH